MPALPAATLDFVRQAQTWLKLCAFRCGEFTGGCGAENSFRSVSDMARACDERDAEMVVPLDDETLDAVAAQCDHSFVGLYKTACSKWIAPSDVEFAETSAFDSEFSSSVSGHALLSGPCR